MPINAPTHQLQLGDKVEIHKSGEVGFVHKLSATEALVRLPGEYRRIHPRQLTWLPTQAQMAADKQRIRRQAGLPDVEDLE